MMRPVTEQFRIAAAATLEDTRSVTARTAREAHGRVMATDPRPTRFRRFVDGIFGLDEEAVGPAGVIRYQYDRMQVVVDFALTTLRARSPVGPPWAGHYRDSHLVFVNGAAAGDDLGDLLFADVIVITNAMPYARKIEVGNMTMQLPGSDHVYEQAAQTVRARFGALVRVRFTYRDLGGVRVPVLELRAR